MIGQIIPKMTIASQGLYLSSPVLVIVQDLILCPILISVLLKVNGSICMSNGYALQYWVQNEALKLKEGLDIETLRHSDVGQQCAGTLPYINARKNYC